MHCHATTSATAGNGQRGMHIIGLRHARGYTLPYFALYYSICTLPLPNSLCIQVCKGRLETHRGMEDPVEDPSHGKHAAHHRARGRHEVVPGSPLLRHDDLHRRQRVRQLRGPHCLSYTLSAYPGQNMVSMMWYHVLKCFAMIIRTDNSTSQVCNTAHCWTSTQSG